MASTELSESDLTRKHDFLLLDKCNFIPYVQHSKSENAKSERERSAAHYVYGAPRQFSAADDHEKAKFVEEVYAELLKIYRRSKFREPARLLGLTPFDLAEFAIRRVVMKTEEYLHRSPLHVANSRATNAFYDLCRRERVGRGEGARGTREVVGQEPVDKNNPQSGSWIDFIPAAYNPQDQLVDRGYYRSVLLKLRAIVADELAWSGLWLTAVEGRTAEEAAMMLRVSRKTLWRRMDALQRCAQARFTELGWAGF